MVVGTINNKNRNIRIDIFKTRTSSDMKLFICNHINEHNNKITDDWSVYSFLDDVNYHYRYEVHVHRPMKILISGNIRHPI